VSGCFKWSIIREIQLKNLARACCFKGVTVQRLYFCAVVAKNGSNGKQSIAPILHTGGTHQGGVPVEFKPTQGRNTPKNHDIHKQKNVNFRH
jgi:hypothetical protein